MVRCSTIVEPNTIVILFAMTVVIGIIIEQIARLWDLHFFTKRLAVNVALKERTPFLFNYNKIF